MGGCIGRPRHSDGDVAYARMPTHDPSVDPPPPYEAAANPSHRIEHRVMTMTDEERFQYARRQTLLQLLPTSEYECKGEKCRECIICMQEFAVSDCVRSLPCMHIYHQKCIDDWLSRSFSCPTCMEDLDEVLSELNSS